MVGQARRVFQHLAGARVLAVEHAQRVALQAVLRILVEPVAVLAQKRHQRLAVAGAVVVIAQGVELQSDLVAQAQLFPQPGGEQDHFRVDVRGGDAEGFHADLVELAAAAGLGPLVAEHGAGVPEPLGLVVEQPVLLGGAHAAGGAFRAQGEAVVVAVGEGVHLFLDDVGHFADAAREQLGALDDGKTNLLVAVGRQHRPGALLQPLPQGRLLGQNVVHATNRRDLVAHRFSLFNVLRGVIRFAGSRLSLRPRAGGPPWRAPCAPARRPGSRT